LQLNEVGGDARFFCMFERKSNVMKTDLYIKAVLTVIAACLVLLTLQNLRVIPAAQATAPEQPGMMLPVNPDGTVEVVIKGFDEDLNVNLEKIGGYGCYNGIPVIVKNN
jgi:hypothetical protein